MLVKTPLPFINVMEVRQQTWTITKKMFWEKKGLTTSAHLCISQKNEPEKCYIWPPPPHRKTKSWTHMIAVDCTNRISLVAGCGCRSSQNNTVLICFGNSSKIIRRNVSTIRWLAIAPRPKMSEETRAQIHFIDLHLARDSFETD